MEPDEPPHGTWEAEELTSCSGEFWQPCPEVGSVSVSSRRLILELGFVCLFCFNWGRLRNIAEAATSFCDTRSLCCFHFTGPG